MILQSLQENTRSMFTTHIIRQKQCFCLLISCSLLFFQSPSPARTIDTPWTPEVSFQSLIYGSSSTADVVRVMGQAPDEVVKATQMFPVIENFYYYDPQKTGSASVFVFENGFLVGFQLKTPGDQYVDLTYMLTNNNDRTLNYPMLGGYVPYYPYFPLTSW